jgi:hypothetical protein
MLPGAQLQEDARERLNTGSTGFRYLSSTFDSLFAAAVGVEGLPGQDKHSEVTK